MTTGLINCLPLSSFQNYWIRHWTYKSAYRAIDCIVKYEL